VEGTFFCPNGMEDFFHCVWLVFPGCPLEVSSPYCHHHNHIYSLSVSFTVMESLALWRSFACFGLPLYDFVPLPGSLTITDYPIKYTLGFIFLCACRVFFTVYGRDIPQTCKVLPPGGIARTSHPGPVNSRPLSL